MATFLDVTLLGSAKVIFIFLLVYVIVWGLLTWIKPFGKSVPNGPYAIIALIAAFLTTINSTMRYLIEFVTPWFLFLVIFLFFVLFAIRMFNVGEDKLFSIVSQPSVYILIISIIIVIMIFGLGSAFGQASLEATQGRADGGTYYQGEGTFDTVITSSGSGQVFVDGQPTTSLQPGDDLNSAGGSGGALQPGMPGATATSNFSLNMVNTLLHPKVLAIIVMILIATITVWLMGRPDWV